MKGDGGASIDAAKLFNGQVELPRAPFFFPPLFSLPFHRRVRASFFLFFLPFSFFLIFFPSFLFIRERGMKVAEDAHFRRACCRCSFNRQFEFTPPAQSTLLPARRDDQPRASVRFRDFESLLSLPLISDGRKSRELVNGFNLELATVSFQIFKIL